MFNFKAAFSVALALIIFQPVSSYAVLLPAGNYSLNLTDCLGANTAPCSGSITTYDVQTPDGNPLSVDGISSFTMNYTSGQSMQASGSPGVALDTSGAGFGVVPVSGTNLQSYRFGYPLFPVVVDTTDYTVRELILTTQDLGGDLFLRFSLKATRFLANGTREMTIFAGYADYLTGQTLPALTNAIQMSIIANDINAYLAEQGPLSTNYDWFSLVGRDELMQTVRNIDAGLISASSISFNLDDRYGVPEPGTTFLLSLGLLGLAVAKRRWLG